MSDNNMPTVPIEEIPDEELFSIPNNKILVDKHNLVYEYINAKLRGFDEDSGKEHIDRLYKNGKISETEYFAKHLSAAGSIAVINSLKNICDVEKLVKEEREKPKYNIEMFLSLRFTDTVKSIKNLMPSEHATSVSPGSYEIEFNDNTCLRFDFLDTYGKIRKEDASVVDFELIELDDETFPDAIILPDKLFSNRITRISEIFIYMEDDRPEEDFTVEEIEEMAIIVTNNENGHSTTIDLTGYINDSTEITIEGP